MGDAVEVVTGEKPQDTDPHVGDERGQDVPGESGAPEQARAEEADQRDARGGDADDLGGRVARNQQTAGYQRPDTAGDEVSGAGRQLCDPVPAAGAARHLQGADGEQVGGRGHRCQGLRGKRERRKGETGLPLHHRDTVQGHLPHASV